MSLNTRQTRKNLNVMVIGGSGSGKSRFYVKPNLMQANTSYVCTDPKGELLRSTGKMLESYGYKIKVFNLTDYKEDIEDVVIDNTIDFIFDQDVIEGLADRVVKWLQKDDKVESLSLIEVV